MSKFLRWALGAGSALVPGLVLAQDYSDTYDPESYEQFELLADQAGAGGDVAGAMAIFGGVMLVFWLVFIVLWILWIFMLVDVAHRQFENPSDKTVWVVVMALLSGLGALIYLIFGRSKGTRPDQPHVAPAAPAAPPPPAKA